MFLIQLDVVGDKHSLLSAVTLMAAPKQSFSSQAADNDFEQLCYLLMPEIILQLFFLFSLILLEFSLTCSRIDGFSFSKYLELSFLTIVYLSVIAPPAETIDIIEPNFWLISFQNDHVLGNIFQC